jgi:hypothetical protein
MPDRRSARPIYNRTTHRQRELERVICDRHGPAGIPAVDDVGIYLEQIACCQLKRLWDKLGTKPSRSVLQDRVDLWCERWAPDVPSLICFDVVDAVWLQPRLDDADACAQALRVSYADRARLKLSTIGAYDIDKVERARLRKQRKRERDRLRDAEKRRAAGAIPRADYLARALSTSRPWEAEGISRRTWERRRHRYLSQNGTESVPIRDTGSAEHKTAVAGPSPTNTSFTAERGTCDTVVAARSAAGRGEPGEELEHRTRPDRTRRARPLSSSRQARARGPRRGERAADAGRRTHAGEPPGSAMGGHP